MIQRTLLRQSQSLRSAIRSSQATSLARPQFLPSSRSFSRAAVASTPTFRLSTSTRWYSTEPEAKQENSEAGKAAEKPEEAEDASKKELEAKNKEIVDLKDRLLRSVAEFRNLQERTKREMQSARDFAIQKFAKDLIESIDNFDRALDNVPAEKLADKENESTKDLISLYDGLKMTEGILMSTLKKHGLERFDPSVEGEKFNPNEHEATFMTAMEGKEDNTVFLTQSKGFKLNGRVLRAAKVGVVKNS